jgi:hypothetical protein
MKNKFFVLTLMALIVLTVLCGCGGNEGPGVSPESIQNIGQGGTEFRFEVTDDTRTVTAWNVRTDKTTVGAALSEAGLISGEGGLYTIVNGIETSFSADGSWWAFYVDGEMSMSGADDTDIDPGKTYAFVYTR